MAWNGLVKKLKRGFGRAVRIGMALAVLGSASCKLPIPTPIPNSPPKITSTPTTQVNEEEPYNYDVNAEDSDGDILTYSLNQAPNWLSIDSATGMISGIAPSVDLDTNNEIVVKVIDGINSVTQPYDLTVKNISQPPIEDYVDISGRLEDNENDGFGRKGPIRVYDASDNSFISEHRVNGNFFITLEKLVSELPSGIIVQAGIDDNQDGILESYVRTRKFSAGDVRDLRIRAVPYKDLNNNGTIEQWEIDDFRTHMEEINIHLYVPGDLAKWNLDNLQGIEILKYDPIKRGYDFSDYEQDIIEGKINDPNDIRSYVEGKSLSIQKDVTPSDQNSNPHYRISDDEKSVIPDTGWIVVVPQGGIAGGSTLVGYEWYEDGRVLTQARINLGLVSEGLVTHEFGHAFIAPDTHAYTLPADYTIMRASGNILEKPGIADKKAAKIIYEDTYKAGEKLNDILALDFLN